MRTLQCMVLIGVCTFASVSVAGIRVPSDWSERQENAGLFPDHRFGNLNSPLGRSVTDNGQEPVSLLYNPFATNHADNPFAATKTEPIMVLNQNGLYILPQNSPQALPLMSNPLIDSSTHLPPLLNPRYSENLGTKAHNKRRSDQILPGYLKEKAKARKLYLSQNQNEAYKKYHVLPSDVASIKPAILGIPSIDKYRQLKEAEMRQAMLNQLAQDYNSGVYKEYPKTPSASTFNPFVREAHFQSPPSQSLSHHIPQNHKFIVSASEEDSNLSPEFQFKPNVESLEFTTKKEPIFFVTEGYRNVLVQGPNKKKKYIGTPRQQKDESRRVPIKQKLEDHDSVKEKDKEEDDKPPRRRKVTKIYRIPENEGKAGDARGSSKNVVQATKEKQRKDFERPQSLVGHGRRSRLRNNSIQNYRDDKLHEPSDDRDLERDNDDKDKITDDREIDSHDDSSKQESDKKTDRTDEVTRESEEHEETGTEENDKAQDVPHSEHADPNPVPTKPFYPGEGQWAKRKLKHRPYVSQHRFIKPAEDVQKPDGYDVFEELEQYFESQKDKFDNNFGQKTIAPIAAVPSSPISSYIQTVRPPNPIVVFDPFNDNRNEKSQSNTYQPQQNYATRGHAPKAVDRDVEKRASTFQEENPHEGEDKEGEESEADEESDVEEADEFVPMKLYSQVRKSENVEHEPYNPAEHGRLKELIKDSKVQTIYTEEGYEDSAYDHAGHEKKAEQDQGYAKFERENEERGKPKHATENDSNAGHSKKVVVSEPLTDSVASDSIYPTEHEQNYVKESENTKTANQNNKAPQTGTSNNFITSQEVKTMQVKDKDNGDVQLEIQSEVKVIVQPNNSTKSHKFVKIFPKVLKEISAEPSDEVEDTSEGLDDEIYSKIHQAINNMAETDSGTKSKDVATSEDLPGISTYDLPRENPKVVVKVLDEDGALKKIADNFPKSEGDLSRKKRNSETAFEEVDIDTDFIDKINHTFAPAKLPEIDIQKYPYYVRPDLNENSPLRYAENIKKIPVKRAGELSFYKMADRLECPDVPQNIDPIPEHIKNADRNNGETEESDDEDEESEEDDESDEDHPPAPKTPRIKLDDKIDCLKVRYFGDDPFDSPFFKEETVGPVKSIFKELDRKANKETNRRNVYSPVKSTDIVENINKVNEIFNKKDEPKFESEVKDKIFNILNESADNKEDTNLEINTLLSIENDNAESIRTNTRILNPPQHDNVLTPESKPTSSPLATLITTPKYTIQLTPENIYDQIKLLDHLPKDDVPDETESTTKRLEQEVKDREKVTTETVTKKTELEEHGGKEESNSRQSKVLKHQDDKNGEVTKEDGVVLEPEAWSRTKTRPRRPIYQIFDVNKFLTTTPFSLINTAATTVLPKYKVLSEVFYKDDIKPNEQLNIFGDILNNIKNSSKIETIPIQSASNFAEPSAVTISSLDEPALIPKIQQPPNVRVKKFQTDSSNQQNTFEDDRADSYNVQTQNHAIKTPNNHYSNRFGHNNKNNNNYKPGSTSSSTTMAGHHIRTSQNAIPTTTPATKSRKILKRRRKPTTSTTTTTTLRTTTNIHVPKQSTPSNHQPYVIDFIEDTEEVVGLVPPQNYQYKTIMMDDSEGRDTIEVPQQINEYQTILPSTATEYFANKHPAPVTEISDEPPPTRAMNMYYFLGLKPPVNKRVRPYSEFANNNIQVNDNLLRRRVAHIGLSRAKRSATRPSYADLSRNRGRQSDDREKIPAPAEDVDDYVPHRPKNYHYDEKTGKIVYHNKQEEQKPEEEEVEYEEIEIPDTPGIYLERAEGATHPTLEKVTTKQLLATATPPPEGKGLLDFVVKLKNNPTYKYIPDPTTPKPGSIASTTEAFVTVDPKSTDPPEFLSILSKVKGDKTYKHIEDPKESKSKSKSTTPESESEEEYDEEQEEEGKNRSRTIRQTNLRIFNIGNFLPVIQTPTSSNIPTNFFKKHVVERIFPRLRYMTPYDIAREYYKQTDLYKFIKKHVQNSPGGQNQNLGNIQIFDIGDYLPKIKSFTPKTTIDYSKYKTIERPHTRHNISSKYNSEDDKESEEEEVVSRPSSDGYKSRGQPVTEEAVESTPVALEERESVDRPVVSQEKVGHDKDLEAVVSPTTQRIVQLRRGTRLTTQRTTAETEEPSELVVTRSTSRKRPVAPGFRGTRRPTTTTEVTEATDTVEKIYPEGSYSDVHDKARRVYRKRPRRIRYTTERHEEDDEEIDKIVRRSLDSKIEDVRNEFQKEYLDDKTVAETYEDIKGDIIDDDSNDELEIDDKEGSESNKKEVVKNSPKDVEVINKEYDKTQKHGGNYKKESETETEAKENKDISSENDKIATEGRSIENDTKKEATEETKKTDDVEIVNKNYDKTKKHGGNYKSEQEEEEGEEKDEEKDSEVAQDEIEEDIKIADEGDDNRNSGKTIDEKKKKLDVDIVNKHYDKTKKHGGNYKSEEDAVIDKLLESTEIPEETELNPNIEHVTLKRLKTGNKKYEKKDKVPEAPVASIDEKGPNSNTDIKLKHKIKPTEIPRLSDVVPKPDHFYSDPRLPQQVNKLGSEKPPVKLSSEELDQVAEEGDLDKETERPEHKGVSPKRRQFDEEDESSESEEVIESTVESEEAKDASTKKPIFIKDPSKRLYFYAPV